MKNRIQNRRAALERRNRFNPRCSARFAQCAALAYILVLFLAVPRAGANTFIVTNTADSGPGTLREALEIANDGDTIDATGISGSITLDSELQVSASVSVQGPGPGTLGVLGGSGYRVFHIIPGLTAQISGFTISDGHPLGGFPTNSGGGIYNDHSDLTVANCVIGPNFATYGGGLYNNAEISGKSSLTLVDCSVTDNQGSDGGGGIYNDSDDNSATFAASLILTNCVLSGNESSGGSGGAIFNYALDGCGSMSLSYCALDSNLSSDEGGAICNYPQNGYGLLNVTACLFAFNSAEYGGGIYNSGADAEGDGDPGAILTVINSTFAFNSAEYGGGGIYNDGENEGRAILTVNYCTFSDNSASTGAGQYDGGSAIFNDGYNDLGLVNATVDIGNTILSVGSGSATTLANLFYRTGDNGTYSSAGYNLSSDNADDQLNGPGDQTDTNPLLDLLQDNGGPTETYALQTNSPAINAGDPAFTPPPYYDQRGPGYPRVVNGYLDIGAFELQAVVVQPPAPTLYISHSSDIVAVFWPNVSGWTLEQNNNLRNPNGWTTNTSWTTVNGTNYLDVTNSTGTWFFRLFNP